MIADICTCFFHATATTRKQQNIIKTLIDEIGTIKYQQGFVDEVIQYLSSLFNRQQSVYDRVLRVIPLCVNDDDNMLSLV